MHQPSPPDDSALAIGRKFYEEKLGFRMTEASAPEHSACWCRIIREGAELMLQETCDEDRLATPRGDGVVFYIHCSSADAVYAELSARGLQIDPPETAYYGMRQIHLQDPDGYRLCFQNPVTPPT
jgi:glyoxylase I family protein